MDSPRSTHRQSWHGQEPADESVPSELSWGEGAASALEWLKKREQRRDRSTPRPDADEQDLLAHGAAAGMPEG